MSDFLYIVAPDAAFNAGLDGELAQDIRDSFAGNLPHNLLSKIRVIMRDEQGGISIEPLADKRIWADVVTHIVSWASSRSKRVVVRLEGHRGNKPLPNMDNRKGTIHDVLGFRRFGHQPYLVEFEIE